MTEWDTWRTLLIPLPFLKMASPCTTWQAGTHTAIHYIQFSKTWIT